MQPRWILAPDAQLNGSDIPWAEICGSDCVTRLLQRRTFGCADDVRSFLTPRLASLSDPFLISGMHEAVERLFRAIDRKERVTVFGDYDVDGITSLALLWQVLRAYGCDCALFLPHRMEEGYGLSAEAITRCVTPHEPQLLIAVDCGTSSHNQIRALRAQGIDVMVLDHHEPKTSLPECHLVNPKVTNPEFAYLCSAGLTFKLCHALLKRRRIEFDLKSVLDLVALGTVADIVPLERDNRVFVKSGSVMIARSRRLGVQKLLEVAAVKPPVMPDHIGFRLGPRLNAAGRLATAEKALRLLMTEDPLEAEHIARELDAQNRERQEVEKAIVTEAEERIASEVSLDADAAIVLAAPNWHPGVLGIVASRITRKFYRPTIIIGFDESGSGKGSGRSIEGFSLVAALKECADLLEKFGGHEMAAGISVQSENLEAFRDRFLAVARAQLSEDALVPRLQLDAQIDLAELNFDLLHWHESLQPFGNGNPQPIFVSCAVEPTEPPRVVGERHLALRFKQRNWHQRGIFFDAAAMQLPTPPWDLAYRIYPGEYEGEPRIEIQVQAIRSATAFN